MEKNEYRHIIEDLTFFRMHLYDLTSSFITPEKTYSQYFTRKSANKTVTSWVFKTNDSIKLKNVFANFFMQLLHGRQWHNSLRINTSTHMSRKQIYACFIIESFNASTWIIEKKLVPTTSTNGLKWKHLCELLNGIIRWDWSSYGENHLPYFERTRQTLAQIHLPMLCAAKITLELFLINWRRCWIFLCSVKCGKIILDEGSVELNSIDIW
jgi:hypothetical protein